jgi:hypothetical protein
MPHRHGIDRRDRQTGLQQGSDEQPVTGLDDTCHLPWHLHALRALRPLCYEGGEAREERRQLLQTSSRRGNAQRPYSVSLLIEHHDRVLAVGPIDPGKPPVPRSFRSRAALLLGARAQRFSWLACSLATRSSSTGARSAACSDRVRPGTRERKANPPGAVALTALAQPFRSQDGSIPLSRDPALLSVEELAAPARRPTLPTPAPGSARCRCRQYHNKVGTRLEQSSRLSRESTCR